jgi:hypothetical protein
MMEPIEEMEGILGGASTVAEMVSQALVGVEKMSPECANSSTVLAPLVVMEPIEKMEGILDGAVTAAEMASEAGAGVENVPRSSYHLRRGHCRQLRRRLPRLRTPLSWTAPATTQLQCL